jgi:hypothetical protein
MFYEERQQLVYFKIFISAFILKYRKLIISGLALFFIAEDIGVLLGFQDFYVYQNKGSFYGSPLPQFVHKDDPLVSDRGLSVDSLIYLAPIFIALFGSWRKSQWIKYLAMATGVLIVFYWFLFYGCMQGSGGFLDRHSMPVAGILLGYLVFTDSRKDLKAMRF